MYRLGIRPTCPSLTGGRIPSRRLAGGGADLWWAASRMQRSCAALPRALLLANMPGFYHIANLDSETAFQEDLLFSFHLFISFFFSPSRDFSSIFVFFLLLLSD